MDTIGDVFGRSFRSGQAIGGAFSSVRFRRGEEKIRQKYTQLAQSEGRNIEDYRPQIQKDLDDLYASSGAKKRGLIGADGQDMSASALGRYDARAMEGSRIRAGQQAQQGAIADSRRTLAGTAFAVGDYDAGIANQQAGDYIDNASAAVGRGPQGGYDSTGAMQGLSAIEGRYGNAAGAAAASQQSKAFRYEAAAGLAGQIAAMLPSAAQNADQIVGLFEGIKQYIPMARNMDLRVGEDGNVAIFINGQAVGSLDDQQEVMGLLTTLQKDPAGVLGAWEQQQAQLAQSQGEYIRERAGKFDDARIEVAKKLADAGVVGAEDFVKASSEAKNAGWKNISSTPEGTLIAQAPNGEIVTVQVGRAGAIPGERNPNGLTITNQNGIPIDQSQLQADPQALFAMQAVLAQNANDALRRQAVLDSIRLLNTLETGQAPASSARRGAAGGGFDALRDAVEQVESGGNPNAVSPAGALGPMQTMPATLEKPGYGVTPARNNSPEEMRRVGNDYLQAMLNEFGDTRTALAAYNWGPGAVQKALAANGGDVDAMLAAAPKETQDYVRKVFAITGGDPMQGADTRTAGAPAQSAGAIPANPVAPANPQRAAPSGPNARQQLLQLRDEMLAAQDELQRWESALEEFTQQNASRARGFDPSGRSFMGNPEVYERIVAARDAAQERYRALLAMTRQGTAGLNRATRDRGIDTEFASIQRRVAGEGGPRQSMHAGQPGQPTLKDIVRSSLQ